MKKGMIILIVVIVLVLVGVALYFLMPKQTVPNTTSDSNTQISTPTNTNSAIDASKNVVTIQNFAFSPQTITIKTGDSITWVNKDSVTHTVVSDSGNGISSQSLTNSMTYSHTFLERGTYSYHCGPHPSMKAKVIVE